MRKIFRYSPPFRTFLTTTLAAGRIFEFEKYNMDRTRDNRADGVQILQTLRC